ncbi:hypothetical protein JYK00_07035 [Thermosipho ferrireducens]|uniref:Peptidase M1 membrane alanine aminopeptidase domain-containing protein n=1 Tax=Thermosipho ferrireducens TaxID=2571116 RepID=A0ABX7S5P3_9BACT|nr:M1 family aminopeptidase [Thermosipho ferrireducens]QTA37484.1 hypothetical protein JYK00_07035 [Thermosipho ferrireducens]
MKRLILIAFLLITVLLFSFEYSLDAIFVPENYEITATLTMNLPEGDYNFFLLPNYSSNNPYIHSLFKNKGTRIEIISVKDKSGNSLEFSIETPESTWLGSKDYKKDTLLKVTSRGEGVVIRFNTYFSDEFLPDNSGNDEIFVWRFGWYPFLVKKLDSIVLYPHKWKLSIRYPDEWMFVGGGVKNGENYYSNGFYASCPIVFLKKDKFKIFKLESKENNLIVYYKKGQQGHAAKVAAFLNNVLAHHEKLLGKLRYKEINVIQSNYPGLWGMAADGIFLLGDGFFTTSDLWIPGVLDPASYYVIAHESAHFWYGVGVSVDFIKDNYLSESLADYIAHISMFDMYNEDPFYNQDVPDVFVDYIYGLLPKTFSDYDQLVLLNTYRSNVNISVAESYKAPSNFRATFDYQKGKRALFSLETLLGKENLIKRLRRYYLENVGSVSNSKKFLSYFSDVDDAVINSLFYSQKPFDAKAYNTENGIYIDLGGLNIPVKVVVETTDGTETFVATQSMYLDYRNILQVSVDPDKKTFDIERHNNYYPVKFALPFDLNPDLFDNYLLSVNFEFETLSSTNTINAYNLKYSLYFKDYPVFEVGLISNNVVIDNISLYDYGAYFKYSPDSFTTFEGKYEFGILEASFSIGIAEDINVGNYSPIREIKHSFAGKFYYNFLQDEIAGITGYQFNNLLKYGYFTGIGYSFNLDSYEVLNSLEVFFTYFFDVESLVKPNFSLVVDYNFEGKKIFKPFEYDVSLLYRKKSEDPFFNVDFSTYSVVDAFLGFASMFPLENRINIFNLASFSGIGFSGGFRYIKTNDFNILGVQVSGAIKLGLVADTMINVVTAFNMYYCMEKEIFTLSMGKSTVGIQLFYTLK